MPITKYATKMHKLLTFSSFKPRITSYVAFMLSQTVVWSLFKFLDEFNQKHNTDIRDKFN